MKPSNLKPKLLLFGGTGSIGRSIQNKFIEKGWDVFIVSRSSIEDDKYIKWKLLYLFNVFNNRFTTILFNG